MNENNTYPDITNTTHNKRCLPLSTEEQRDFYKRIKTHHTNHKHIVHLEAPNGLPAQLVLVPTPRKGTADVCKRTIQQRSQMIETIQQLVSTPSTSTSSTSSSAASSTTTRHHLETQLTSVIKRNKDMYTSCTEAAGITVLHRFSVDKMLELHKLISAPYSLLRNIRSFLHQEGMI